MIEQILERLKVEYDFGEIIGDPVYPKQGLSSAVFFLKFSTGREIVVKYGDCVDKDLLYIKLINENRLGVEVPEIYGYFQIDNIHILLLEKIKGKLFGDVERDDLPKYFDTVISTLQELHKLKKKENNWKQYLSDIFNGKTINWDEVLERKMVDKNLLQSSLQKIKEIINNLDFEDKETSLLHTDFNQSNLFIEEKTFKITGVIDWEEAVFGDPVYDYARFHLHLWHREVDKNIINNFLEQLNLNNTQKKNEKMYFLFFVLHYIAYYSESSDEFRIQRVKTHQDFLRNNFTK
jgi:aminoglycoside phosphotransferase (APT) family kinase protein